LWCRLF